MPTNKTTNRAIPKIIPNQQQPQPRHHHRFARWEIAKFALASRIFLLLAMSFSCSILPDFYPGDDVLQFDLRLMPSSSSWSYSEDEKDHCFCLKGHACDVVNRNRYRRKETSNDIMSSSSSCADDNSTIHNNADNNNVHHKSEGSSSSVAAARYTWLDGIYAFILPPVTKWDAARFLTLSVDPWARYPPRIDETCNNSNDDSDSSSSNNNSTKICEASPIDNDERRFYPSEQSHAFLPLLPLFIRYTTIAMTKVIPSHILPPTYESTTALSAIVINTVAFVIAAISLYDLTIYMLKIEGGRTLEKNSNSSTTNNDDEASTAQYHHHLLANTAGRLFCINPAGVFFTAAYSESVFAMLTFAGHAIAIRGQFFVQRRVLLQTTETIQTNGIKKGFGTSLLSCCWWWVSSNFYWMASTAMWMLASYTRSNGTFSSIWLLLVGVSKCCSCIIILHHYHKSTKIQNTAKVVAIKCLSSLLFSGALAFLVAYPVYYHDRRGYNFHCLTTAAPILQQITTQSNHHFPTWCDHDDGIMDRDRRGLFSLYAYVQRKHWNVGLFRYYEMKQIPNFILAMPVLALSFAAAVWWIRYSWSRHTRRSIVAKSPFENNFRVMKDVVPWAFLALGASSSCDFYPLQRQGKGNKPCLSNTQPSTAKTLDGRDIISTMLRGPNFLSYYAILAGFAFVGTFLAHVQISTRLICSSCPAFYWFVTSFISPSMMTGREGKSKCSGDSGVFGFASRTLLHMIYFYFGLYNLLGVVMHVNWLPWT